MAAAAGSKEERQAIYRRIAWERAKAVEKRLGMELNPNLSDAVLSELGLKLALNADLSQFEAAAIATADKASWHPLLRRRFGQGLLQFLVDSPGPTPLLRPCLLPLMQEHTVVFSDVNVVSGMEQQSFLFQQAAQIGIPHATLLRFLVGRACKRAGLPEPKPLPPRAVAGSSLV